MYISLNIFKNIFSIFFIFYLAKKSLKFLKCKNIQESGYCSKLLSFSNNKEKRFMRNTERLIFKNIFVSVSYVYCFSLYDFYMNNIICVNYTLQIA